MDLAFLQNMGLTEWVLMVLVCLLVFGASRIPKIARSLGRSAKEFKKGLKEGAAEDDEDKDEKDEDEKK